MKYKTLSNTDLEVSTITLGTWVFGGLHWSGAKKADAIAAVKEALSSGINCIDTAPIYSNGDSEEIIGQAIKGKRDQVVLATKCGLTVEGRQIHKDLSAKKIFNEVDQSLRRLQTDRIDLYQCHWPDDATPIEETMEALLKLQESGKIRYIGLSNYSAEQMEKARKFAPIVTSQEQYSMLDRAIESEQLPYLKKNRIDLLAYGPLAGGILTGKYKEAPEFKGADARNFFYQYYQGDSFAKVQSFLEILEKIGKPLNQIAINWVRQQEGVGTVLVGARNPEQVIANAQAASWDLSQEELEIIKQALKEVPCG